MTSNKALQLNDRPKNTLCPHPFTYDLADYVGQWTNGDDIFTLELTDFGYQLKKNGT